jgi:hypothetical protein
MVGSERMECERQSFAEAVPVAYQARKLVVAVLLAAVEDAQSDDPALAAEARRWLEGEGAIWAEMLDISPERVMGWVGRLPVLPYEQLTLFD